MGKRSFKKWSQPVFDKNGVTKWNWMCQHCKNLKLGKYTDIGAFSYINARYGVEIEEYVQIGSHCSIYSESTIDDKRGKVTIKKGVRIGTHSTIMPGVTIGEDAVVGAYSFVKTDIPKKSLSYGIPAEVIKNEKH